MAVFRLLCSQSAKAVPSLRSSLLYLERRALTIPNIRAIIAAMSLEIRSNDKARKVKVISAIACIGGMLGICLIQWHPAQVLFLIAFLGGFIGFIVGRFME
jgi:uncharacterized membrane protein YjjB (DUF3815 family)